MTTDDWLTAALTDDAMVVELLFLLRHSSESFASPPPPLRWGHRQRRSKPAAARKDRDSMRCSPTTPLSWSCGAGDGSSDGCDESSRPSDRSSGGRSKGSFTGDTTATTTGATNKRSRKKKTFAELKEEENLLLKQRINLNKELATLRVTFNEQKARSDHFKRIKLDLHSQSANKMAAAAADDLKAANSHQQPNLTEASTLHHIPASPTITMHGDRPAPDSCKVEKEVETRERCFVLPDLNTTPSEEDSGDESLYGFS
ncbi:unnamed protein product [Camellia sinensis]